MAEKQKRRQILLIPRPDGFVVSIDGVIYHKQMTADQMLWLADRTLQTGLVMLRDERMMNER